MSIQSEITRLKNAKADIASAIAEKGVSVPSGTALDDMADLIRSISSEEDLDSLLTEQEASIYTLQETLRTKASGGSSGGGSIPTCTVTLDENFYITHRADQYAMVSFSYSKLEDGVINFGDYLIHSDGSGQVVFENVPINTFFAIYGVADGYAITVEGDESYIDAAAMDFVYIWIGGDTALV